MTFNRWSDVLPYARSFFIFLKKMQQPNIANQDLQFMRLALELAAQAVTAGEVPVGAVVVKDGRVLGQGRNSPIHAIDPTAHAEISALREAAKTLGNYRLDGCTLYVSLEPCAMCCGAILHARIGRIVFAARDAKTGCAGSVLNLFEKTQLNHQTVVEGGLLASESAAMLQDFFQSKRQGQRQQALPLREDALRPEPQRFDSLANYPWPSSFVSDLPVLDGLRMHYLDLGHTPTKGASVTVLLHRVPGWSYLHRDAIAKALGQGARVIAPDLIGFGKSDQPKREHVHTLAFHRDCLLQLMQRLRVDRARLIVPASLNTLGQALFDQGQAFIASLEVQPKELSPWSPEDLQALHAPYPNAGHRAGERAFAAAIAN